MKLIETLRSMPAGIIITDDKEIILAVSETAATVIGIPDEQKHFGEIFKDLSSVNDIPADCFVVRETVDGKYVKLRKGEYLDPDSGGLIYAIAVESAEYLKEVDRSRIKSFEISGMKQLVSTVVHDFNNMIGAIYVSLSLLEKILKDDEKGMRRHSTIAECTSRIEKDTRLLSHFSRRGRKEAEKIYIEDLFIEVIPLIKSYVHEGVAVSYQIDGEELVINGIRQQITSILLCLADNAANAIEGPGKVEFSAENIEVAEDGDFPEGLSAGEYLKISVSDTGKGIAEAVQSRIFDPDYTTKDGSGSSGLGLSVLKSVLKKHGGGVSISSEPGRGTAFYIFLPKDHPM